MRALLFTMLCCGFWTQLTAQSGAVGIGTTTPTEQLHTTGGVRLEGYAGSGTRLVQMDSSGRLVVTGAGPVLSNTTAMPILPDAGCGTGSGITQTITVSGQPQAVASSKISVRLNITHTYTGDLYIFLVAPNGAVLCLASAAGGGGDNFTNTVFADGAPALSLAPFAGRFKPDGDLATFCLLTSTVSSFGAIGGGSIVPSGVWALKIYDNQAGDGGTLNSWSLSFSGPESFATADEQGRVPYFSGGDLAPSGMTALANGNIGIGTPAPAAALHVAGSLRVSTGTPAAGKVLAAQNASGDVGWRQLPSYQTGFNTVSASSISVLPNTAVTVPFHIIGGNNVLTFSDGNNFNYATYSYQAPAHGVYHFDAQVAFPVGMTTGAITFKVMAVSSVHGVIQENLVTLPAGEPFPTTIPLTFTTQMTAGTNLSIKVQHNGPGNINLPGSDASFFSGYRVY